MKKALLLLSACCFSVLPGFTQQSICPVQAISSPQRDNYEAVLQSWIDQNPTVASTITIPVVVHVIWRTATQNITDAQVFSQIDVLNEDFGRYNADTLNTPAGFQPVAANTGIQFCMAQVDPYGNPTNGIHRVQTSTITFTNPGNVQHTNTGGTDAWDPARYYNIWVCNLSSAGPLGYVEFPTSTLSQTYGVIIRHDVFGRIGTVSFPFHKGRACTHFVGHSLNLLHVSDDQNCNDVDQVADTPTHFNPLNSACLTYPVLDNCNPSAPGVMYMNYMVITSDDSCINMFTYGQAARMNAVLNVPPYNSLDTSTACGPLGIIRHESSADLIFVLPNPSQGIFSISFNGTSAAKIIVYDIIGNVIAEYSPATTSTLQIDLSSESKGIYFLQIITKENQQINKKIILSN